ncbi:MAG: hypothetical protein Ta2D_00920 [Rickettsiales bacterium]|nr:MAG: hypothetical protein Ta2D_00920 [Rickettsiales bacterium]
MNLTLTFEPEMYNAIAKTAQIENVAIENYAERILIEKMNIEAIMEAVNEKGGGLPIEDFIKKCEKNFEIKYLK